MHKETIEGETSVIELYDLTSVPILAKQPSLPSTKSLDLLNFSML